MSRRRAIVDGADRHREQMSGDARAFLHDDAAIPHAAGDRADLGETLQPDIEKRIHHGGHEQLAARVFLPVLRHVHVVLAGRELDRAAQRLPAHGRDLRPHLFGQAEQHRLRQCLALEILGRDELPAGRLEVEQRAHHIGQRKQRQQCHDVRETLVKRRLVRCRRLQVAPAQPVEDRMRRLVRDDVVRETGVDALAARHP